MQSLGENNVFSIKSKIIAIVVAVVGAIGLGMFIYDKGYDNGVQYVNEQVTLQRQQWEQRVEQLQDQHNITIATITQKHNDQIDQLNKQIQTLKDHPKIITKYVDRTVPVTNGIATAHDRAAQNIPLYIMLPDNFKPNDPSEYSSADLVNTIVKNYNSCNVCIQRLTALQDIVKQYQQKQNQMVEGK